MSENSKIQWTDHTWSPWYGCTKISPGCANCYAEALNHRFKGDNWGKGKPRRKAADWRKPRRWNRYPWLCDKCGSRFNDPDLLGNPGVCSECACGNTLTMRGPLVFPSQCDWLDPEVPIELFAEFLQLIHETPHLTWQLLTKRPELWKERIAEVGAFLDGDEGDNCEWAEPMLNDWWEGTPPPNVWVGVSVEDQQRADERIPALLDIPAKLRFLSVEPLLGPVDIPIADRQLLDWVIIGGESGPGARPCNVEWIRSIKDQCQAADVPVFVKQFGAKATGSGFCRDCADENGTCPNSELPCDGLKDPKGGDPEEWPADLRVRQMPEEVSQ